MVQEIRPSRTGPGFSISCQGGEDCISKGPKTIRRKSHLHLGNRTVELSPAGGQGRGKWILSSGPLIFLSHTFTCTVFKGESQAWIRLMTAITNLAPSFHLLLKGSRGRSENLRCQTCSLGFFFLPSVKTSEKALPALRDKGSHGRQASNPLPLLTQTSACLFPPRVSQTAPG